MIALLERLFRPAPARVEPAGLRDATALARLHAASFHRGWSEHEFEELLRDRAVLAHRLLIGRAVCGFILSRRAADEAEILSVAVAPRARGRGRSKHLLRTHLGTLAAGGTRTVFLEVEEGNAPARALYLRAGFRDVGRREGYYRNSAAEPARAMVMRRDLS